MLPLELGDPGLFGDDLQLVPGCIALLLEPTSITIVVARARGVGTAGLSRGIARHGWGCGWCRGRTPPDEPGRTKKIVRDEKGSKRGCEEANGHHLWRAPAWLPSASSLARRLLLLFSMELLGVLVLERKSLDWQRLGRYRTW
jgi:hypothetical protein